MNDLEKDQPSLGLQNPYDLLAPHWGLAVASGEPWSLPVGEGTSATLTHAEVAGKAPAGCEAAGVLAQSSTTATAERTGKSWPNFFRLYAHRERLIEMVSGDLLRLWAPKSGRVVLRVAVRPLKDSQ
jgi:hypothetical protein